MAGINDRYGFESGNEVLQAFATSTYNLIRKSDFLARGEDDNFYVVLTDTDNYEAKTICERIIEAFEQQCDLPVTLCFGGACYSIDKKQSTEQLLGLVDEHLKFAQDRSKITDNHEQSIHFNEQNSVVRLIK
jgi:diguanylate cyclase (GGDEF)-like protein